MPQLQKAEDGQFVLRVCPSLRQRRLWPLGLAKPYIPPRTISSFSCQAGMLTSSPCVLTEMRRNQACVPTVRQGESSGRMRLRASFLLSSDRFCPI